jgi:hypothetical protein
MKQIGQPTTRYYVHSPNYYYTNVSAVDELRRPKSNGLAAPEDPEQLFGKKTWKSLGDLQNVSREFNGQGLRRGGHSA